MLNSTITYCLNYLTANFFEAHLVNVRYSSYINKTELRYSVKLLSAAPSWAKVVDCQWGRARVILL